MSFMDKVKQGMDKAKGEVSEFSSDYEDPARHQQP
jgi:hypothetical protein